MKLPHLRPLAAALAITAGGCAAAPGSDRPATAARSPGPEIVVKVCVAASGAISSAEIVKSDDASLNEGVLATIKASRRNPPLAPFCTNEQYPLIKRTGGEQPKMLPPKLAEKRLLIDPFREPY